VISKFQTLARQAVLVQCLAYLVQQAVVMQLQR